MPAFSVIIPTYNERKNIEILIRLLERVFERKMYKGEIVVVDDNSPDGTAEAAERLNTRYGNIRVIIRKVRTGVGGALKEGLLRACGKIIVTMDADLSHDPMALPTLIEKIDKGFDFVIGSRYIKGGKIVGWSFHRRLISSIANVFARYFLCTGVRENTTNYRAFKRELLSKKEIRSLSDGYTFFIELLHLLVRKPGVKIAEVPITFVERKYGSSKLNTISESLKWLWTIILLKIGAK